MFCHFRIPKDFSAGGMIIVCLQHSVLQITNLRECSKLHLVSDCTALW
jgi:hypothetical protein